MSWCAATLACLGSQQTGEAELVGATRAVVRQDRLQHLVDVTGIVCRRKNLMNAVRLDALLPLQLLVVVGCHRDRPHTKPSPPGTHQGGPLPDRWASASPSPGGIVPAVPSASPLFGAPSSPAATRANGSPTVKAATMAIASAVRPYGSLIRILHRPPQRPVGSPTAAHVRGKMSHVFEPARIGGAVGRVHFGETGRQGEGRHAAAELGDPQRVRFEGAQEDQQLDGTGMQESTTAGTAPGARQRATEPRCGGPPAHRSPSSEPARPA